MIVPNYITFPKQKKPGAISAGLCNQSLVRHRDRQGLITSLDQIGDLGVVADHVPEALLGVTTNAELARDELVNAICTTTTRAGVGVVIGDGAESVCTILPFVTLTVREQIGKIADSASHPSRELLLSAITHGPAREELDSVIVLEIDRHQTLKLLLEHLLGADESIDDVRNVIDTIDHIRAMANTNAQRCIMHVHVVSERVITHRADVCVVHEQRARSIVGIAEVEERIELTTPDNELTSRLDVNRDENTSTVANRADRGDVSTLNASNGLTDDLEEALVGKRMVGVLVEGPPDDLVIVRANEDPERGANALVLQILLDNFPGPQEVILHAEIALDLSEIVPSHRPTLLPITFEDIMHSC